MQNCNSPVLCQESSSLPRRQSDLYHYSHTFQRRLKPLCVALGAALLLGGGMLQPVPLNAADWNLSGGDGGGGGQSGSLYVKEDSHNDGSPGGGGGNGTSGSGGGGGGGGAAAGGPGCWAHGGSDGGAGTNTGGGGGGGGGGAGGYNGDYELGTGGQGGSGGSFSANISAGTYDTITLQGGSGAGPGGFGPHKYPAGTGGGGGGGGVTGKAAGAITASNVNIASGNGSGGAKPGQGGAGGGGGSRHGGYGGTGGGGGAAFDGSGATITVNGTLTLTSNSGDVSFNADRLLANQMNITKNSGALNFQVNKLEVANNWDPDWNVSGSGYNASVSNSGYNASADYLYLTGNKRLFFDVGANDQDQINYNKGDNINAGRITIGQLYISGGTLNDYGGTYDPDGNWKTFVGGGLQYSSSNDIIAEGTVTIDIKNDQTLTRIMTGLGSLVKNNTGTFTLTDNISTYTGTTTINGGKLALKGKSSLAASVVTVNSAGILDVTQIAAGGGSVAGLSGGGKVFVGNKTLTVSTISDSTFSGVIADAGGIVNGSNGGLIKDDADRSKAKTLILSGTNTYTGTTTITSGTLQLGNNTTTGSVAGDLVNNATLAFAYSNAQTHTKTIHGTGSVIQRGKAVLTLSGANIYGGNTTVSSGGLKLTGTIDSDANASNGYVYTGAINNAATLEFATNQEQEIRGVISGNGSLTVSGTTHTLTLSAANTYSGATSVSAGARLNITGSLDNVTGNDFNYSAAFANAGVTTFNQKDDQKLSGVYSGNGELIKQNSNTLTLSGANTYNGATFTVNGGKLQVAHSGALTFNNHISAGAATAVLAFDLGNTSNVLTIGANAGGVFTGTVDVQRATINLDETNVDTLLNGTTSTQLQLSSGSKATMSKTTALRNLTFNGGMLDMTAFTGSAAAVDLLTLSGTLDATSAAGTIMVEIAALNTVADTNAITATNYYDYVDTSKQHQVELIKAANVTSGASHLSLVDSDGKALTDKAHLEYIGGVDATSANGVATQNYGAWVTTGTDGGVWLGYGLTQIEAYNGKQVTIDSSTSTVTAPELEAKLTGQGSFIFSGSKAATLGSGGNDYTGATKVENTNLTLKSGNAFGNTSGLTLAAATLKVNSNLSQTVGSLNSAAGDTSTLTLESGSVLNIGVDGDAVRTGNGTYTAKITGEGSLVKAGSGTQTLAGTNTYTGTTSISGGELAITGTLDSVTTDSVYNYAGAIAMGNGTNLSFTQTQDQTLSGVISGSGTLAQKSVGKTLTLTGNNTYTGNTSVGQGSTLLVSGAGKLGQGKYTGVLDNAGTATFNQTADQEFANTVSGAGELDLNSATQFTFSAANTYTGKTVIGASGTTMLVTGSLGNGNIHTGAIANSGTLNFKQLVGKVAVQKISGVISGTGNLNQQGNNNLELAGHNTYSGATSIVEGGTLTLSGTLDSVTSDSVYNYANTIANHGALVVSSNDQQTLSGVISEAGTLTQNGSGELTLTAVNTYTGNTTIAQSSTLTIGGAGNLGSGTYASAIVNDGTLNYNTSSAQRLDGIISGSGDLTQKGSGALTLTGQNTYTGDTSIAAASGGLTISGTGLLGQSGVYQGKVDLSGTLTFNTSENQTLNNIVSGSGTLNQNGSGVLTLSSKQNSYQGAVNIAASRQLVVTGLIGSGSYTGAITNNGTLTFDTNNQIITSGIAGSSASILENKQGKLTLSGDNTYTGTTKVYSGASLLVNGTLGHGATNNYVGAIENDGTLTFTQAVDQTLTGAISGTGTLTQSGSKNLTLAGNNAYSGETTISNGVLTITGALDSDAGTAGYDYAATIDNATQLTFNSAQAQKLSGAISGVGKLTQSGSGELTLAAENSYTGTTTIANSSKLTVTGSLGRGDYNSKISNAGTLTFAQHNDDQFLSNEVSGSGKLVYSGSKTLTLAGANTYTGETQISSGNVLVTGTLGTLANGGATHTGAIDNSGTLTFEQTINEQELSGVLTGGGTLVKNNSNTLLISNTANTYNHNATFSVNAGTLKITGNADLAFNNKLSVGNKDAVLAFDLGGSARKLSFGANTQKVFTGTVDLANATIDLDDVNNANLLGGAATTTLQLGQGAIATVSNASRKISNLAFNGGALDLTAFAGTAGSAQMLKVSVMKALAGGGTIKIDVSDLSSVSTSAALPENTNFYDYVANEHHQVQLVQADQILTDKGILALVDSTGNPFTGQEKYEYINGSSSTDADGRATLNYKAQLEATPIPPGATPGVYLGYGLVSIEAFANKAVTLNSATSAVDAGKRTINVKLTGDGGFNFIGDKSSGNVGNADSDYNGATKISNTEIVAISNNLFGKTVELTMNKATLDLKANSQTVGSLNDGQGSTIKFVEGSTLTVGVNGDTARTGSGTFNGEISGAGQFHKAGSGVLTLNGNNAWSGDSVVSGGQLVITGQLNLGSYAGKIDNNATLTFNQSAAQSLDGVISGTGILEQNGSKALTLTAVNTYTGDTHIGSGSQLIVGGQLNSGDYAAAIVNNGTLTMQQYLDQTLSGNISGSGSLEKKYSGTLTLSGSNSYGDTTVCGGTLEFVSDSNIGTGSNTLDSATLSLTGTSYSKNWALGVGSAYTNPDDGTVSLPADNVIQISDDVTFGGVLSDAVSGTSAGFTKTGNGTLTLSGTSTYTGNTTIAINGLTITGLLGSGNYIGAINNSGTLTFTPSADQTLGGTVSGSGTLHKTGAHTLTLANADNDYSGDTFVGSGGGLTVSGRLGKGNYGGKIANDGALTFNQHNGYYQTVSGVISGSGTLSTTGTNTLNLSGINTYSGATSIDNAKATLEVTGALGNYDYQNTISNNGHLIFNQNGGEQTLDGVISGNGIFSQIGKDATLTLTANNTHGGHIEIGSGSTLKVTGTLGYDSSTGHANYGGVIDNSGTLIFVQNVNQELSGNITNLEGGLVKRGSGTLTLTGVNNYKGDTTIGTGSTLVFDPKGTSAVANNSLEGTVYGEAGSLLVKGTANGVMDDRPDLFVGELQTQGDVRIDGGTFGIQKQTGNQAHDVVVGPGGNPYNTSAPGTFTLLGLTVDETQTDPALMVNSITWGHKGDGMDGNRWNGLLVSGFIASSKEEVTLEVLRSNTSITGFEEEKLDINGHRVVRVLAGWGSIDSTDSDGADFLNLGATLWQLDGAPAESSIFVTIGLDWYGPEGTQGGDFTLGEGSHFTVGVPLEDYNPSQQGSGDDWDGKTLYKKGDGTLILTADNTYTGSTYVQNGTLQIGNGTQPEGDATGGSLQGTSQVVLGESPPPTSGSCVGACDEGTLAFNLVKDATFDKQIVGSGNVVQRGTGVLTLSEQNSYSGMTHVETGSLSIASDDNIGQGANILGNGGNGSSAGGNQSSGTGSGGNDGVLKPAGGRLVLTGTQYDKDWQLGHGDNTITVPQDGDVQFAADMSNVASNNVGGFTKDGEGRITFTGNHSYTGAVTLKAGSVVVPTDDNIGDGSLTLDGATLELPGASYAKNWNLGTGNNVIFVDNNDVLFSGALSDAPRVSGAGFVKTGSKMLTIANNHSFSGPMQIVEGGVTVVGSLLHGSYGGAISNDGAFIIDHDVAQTLSGNLSGSGTLTKRGSGVLTLSGSNTMAGDMLIHSGKMRLVGAAGPTGGNLTFHENSELDITQMSSNSLNYSNKTVSLAVDMGQELVAGVHAKITANPKQTISFANANVNFEMPELYSPVQTMLRVVGGTVDVSNMNITLTAPPRVLKELENGDYVTLIDADAITGTQTIKGEPVMVRSSVFDYLFHITDCNMSTIGTCPGDLYAYFGSKRPNENAGSLVFGNAARVASLATEFDLALSLIDHWKYSGKGRFAPSPGEAATGFSTFATSSLSSITTRTGSEVKTNGFNIIGGGAWDGTLGNGDVLFGAYVETGRGTYDSYMDASMYGDASRGNGDTWYYGGGLFAKYTFADNLYFDASLRAGVSHVEYNGLGAMDYMNYKTHDPYYGAHLGMGHEYHLNEQVIFDFYAKAIWIKQKSDPFTANTGEVIAFEDYSSLRSRVGMRTMFDKSDEFRWWVGGYWDYEAKGGIKAKVGDGTSMMPIDYKSTLKGHSGAVQAGVEWNSGTGWNVEAGATGMFGKRKGGAVNLLMTYRF